MTSTELIEAATQYYGLAIEILAFYFTVTSAYLIVGFLVGDRLTRSQVLYISVLYIFMASLSSYTFFAWASRGVYFSFQLDMARTGEPIYATTWIVEAFSMLLGAGILASLKFFWDVRHRRAE
jgi:hypothetical protein